MGQECGICGDASGFPRISAARVHPLTLIKGIIGSGAGIISRTILLEPFGQTTKILI